MDILIIIGIALIIVSIVLILKNRSDKKINFKDRIKLETILEDEEFIENDVERAAGNLAFGSTEVLLSAANIEDDSMITFTDKSIKFYDKGVALVKEKKYEESIPYLNEAIRLNSSEGITYYYRGLAKSKLNLFKDAIEDFTDAMLRRTKEVDVFFQRGFARLKIEDNENALLDFTHYISVKKSNPEVFYHKGVLEYERKNYQRAIDDFSNAIILSPNHESAYFKRGMAKQITGDISGCCIDLKTAFEKGNLEAYHYMKKFCD
jgi:tetratricopeptide (TPR) repeat protein